MREEVSKGNAFPCTVCLVVNLGKDFEIKQVMDKTSP